MERWPGMPWNPGPTSRGIMARHAVESAWHPDRYNARHLRTLLKTWRREAVKRLICEMQGFTQNVGSGPE
jgi:hypothetical protein